MSNINNRTVIKKSLNDSNRPPSSTSQKSNLSDLQQYQKNGMSFQDYMTMKVLPPDSQAQQTSSQNDSQKTSQQQSSYKGSLASQKFFTPKELNALNLSKRPDSNNKKILKEELKKANGPVKANHQQISALDSVDQFMQPKQSLDQEQQEKLKNLNRRPFSVKSSRQGSRPGTAQSDINGKENQSNSKVNDSSYAFQLENDVYEEISIPDVNYEERRNLLKQIEQRQKDREELDLEDCFQSLKSQVQNEKDIDELSTYSMRELKEEKQINIYKPTLKKNNNKSATQHVINEYPSPVQNKPMKQDNLNFYPQSNNSLVPLPTGEGQSRLDQIYKQIKDLQSFKDEIMDDLEEFMDEVETNSLVTIPEQFDEVVDIVVNEQRDRGERIVERQEAINNKSHVEEVLDESGKPFWMKFLKEDYLGETQNLKQQIKEKGNNMSKKITELTDKEEKLKRELQKIRKLDAELAQKTKLQRDFKNQVMARKQEEEKRDEQRQLVVAQQQQQQQVSQTQSSKGFNSTAKKQPQRAQSKGKPPSQGQQQRNGKNNASQKDQNRQQDEGSDTFLTDALFRGHKKSSTSSSVKKGGRIDEDDDEDSDEYQDVVYDYDQSQALMDMADDYLNKPLLSLPPIEEHSPSKLNQTSNSFMTNMTSKSGNKDFLQMNKDQAKSFNPYKKPMICDQLDEQSKNRLDSLMKDIDDNLDDIIKEKQDFYSADINKSQFTNKINDGKNAYLYSKDDIDSIEKINQSLMKMTPMLPPSENFDQSKMMMQDNQDYKSNYDHSKFLNDDTQSMRSQPMSVMTRKSNFTLLSHQTFQTSLTKLPKERKLREMAEKRLLNNQLKAIDDNLKKINETDDLSYANTKDNMSQIQMIGGNSDNSIGQVQVRKQLIDPDTLLRLIEEAREDEERMSVMNEMNGVDNVSVSGYTERSQLQLAKIDDQSRLFKEAEAAFKDIASVKEEYWKVLDSAQEREKAILQIEERVKKLSKQNEGQELIIKKQRDLKDKLQQQEDELNSIINNLESKEQQIKQLQEMNEQGFNRFEQQFFDQENKKQQLIMAENEEANDGLDKIIQDINNFQHMEKEQEEEDERERQRNLQLLKELEKQQEGRDDNVNELLVFANKQLDLYQEQQDKEEQEQR